MLTRLTQVATLNPSANTSNARLSSRSDRRIVAFGVTVLYEVRVYVLRN